MSNLPTRSQREKRAYQMTLAAGGTGLATVVVLVLAIVGVASFGLAVLLAVVTAVLGFALKRSLGA